MDRIEELNQQIEALENELKELKLERMALSAKSAQHFLKGQQAKLLKMYRESDRFHRYLNAHVEWLDRSYPPKVCMRIFTEEALMKVSNGKRFEDLDIDEKYKLREEVDNLIEQLKKDAMEED